MPKTVPRAPRPELESPHPRMLQRGARVFDAGELGHVVRWTRGVRQLTQQQLADGSGVSRKLLRALERGEGTTSLQAALDVLATLGYDLVLVPRDPSLSLRDDPA